jgi:hypothetical protein
MVYIFTLPVYIINIYIYTLPRDTFDGVEPILIVQVNRGTNQAACTPTIPFALSPFLLLASSIRCHPCDVKPPSGPAARFS